jgi:CMP-N,N'-diacetyllegionaminic acid synthase
MYKSYAILCTVCARGGSKGLKGKNKAVVAEKPLISYTLDTAKACAIFDDIIVSTDDEEIKHIATSSNVAAPFTRPEELSLDDTPKIAVIRHAVEWAQNHYRKEYDIIVDLSVVSPFRTVLDIENAVGILVDENADNVFSVAPPYRNPYYNMVEVVNQQVRLVKEPRHPLVRRQDAPVVYDMNDSINVWWKHTLSAEDKIFNRNTKIYIMPRHRSIDIDDEFDLLIASILMEYPQRLQSIQ